MKAPLIIGNWKMNGTSSSLTEVEAIASAASQYNAVDVALALPATLLHRAWAQSGGLLLGGQDCDEFPEGAFTGSISAPMLQDAGARFVLLGHSERRAKGDSDAVVSRKVKQADAVGLRTVVCVGDCDSDRPRSVPEAVANELDRSLPKRCKAPMAVAYEPAWAIGTGVVPEPDEVATVTKVVRSLLDDRGFEPTAVLYGGSVTGPTAHSLLSDASIDGLLVGGASLLCSTFEPIVKATMGLPGGSPRKRPDREARV